MKIKILASLLIALFLQVSIFAQEEVDQTLNFKHSVGVGAGFTTGYGLSYRFTPNKFGIQATFAPYKDNNRNKISLGITFLYKLIETENVNLFAYQGNQYSYEKTEYTSYIWGSSQETRVEQYFNNGIGLGMEFIILKRVSFNIMGGYAGYEDFERISFTGETGLYFKF